MPVGDGPGREHCAVQDQEAHRTQEADGHLLRAGGSRAPGILLGPTFGEKEKKIINSRHGVINSVRV